MHLNSCSRTTKKLKKIGDFSIFRICENWLLNLTMKSDELNEQKTHKSMLEENLYLAIFNF